MTTIYKPKKPTFKCTTTAFDEAIKSGRLSENPKDKNYYGPYMYMGTWDGVDEFKNVVTRLCLKHEKSAFKLKLQGLI